ncbi:hypothetical protein [Flammeovirga sp. OC4]|uniref:hypothetical protein n=1 Tax=Flammeovirga sp. OC4 TaxID=1382345 RepID=UPI0005C6E6A5|nr:hypothetical protein [Flammeovirga sp. OC4]
MIQHYNDVDQKLHQLSQVIAKFNRSFVPQKEDDSHTNLQYDIIGNRILGRWIDTSKGKVIVSLNIITLHFSVYNQKWEVVFEASVIDKTQEEIENSFLPFCNDYHLSFDTFKTPLHFEIETYSFLKNKYTALPTDGIEEWKKWRKTAFETCGLLLEHLQLKSEIRIWPHHFDTGIYVEVNSEMSFGFGLAMKDNVCEMPYFYFSAYGIHQHKMNYDNFPPLQVGCWKNLSHWKGAVLEIDQISKEKLSSFIIEVKQNYFSN